MSEKIILNEDQEAILERLKTFLDSAGESHMILFEGCAGTGKTTTLMQLVEHFLKNSMFSKICMCAPTNKAVKVMREMCPPSLAGDITFCSLHGLLGLKHTITKDGKEVFERDKSGKTFSNLHTYDLVIVDESSMIADQVFHELEDQNYRGVKVIFVGDRNQINPVDHVHSIPMIDEKRDFYKIGHCQLSKIVRQAEGNPIIKYSQKILNDDFQFQVGAREMQGESGICMIDKYQSAVVRQLFQYYFCNETFDQNANHCKVVAWRNKTVDDYNELIRFLKYGKVGKIVKGEKLIVDKPIKGETKDEIIFTTNEDLDVLDVSVSMKTLYNIDFHFYECLVVGDSGEEHTIHILHEKSTKDYTQYLKKLADSAKNEKDIRTRIDKWRSYFGFQDNFAQVNYNYAITCHSAQGSTYTNCFVDYSDIKVNWNEKERKRILYTAFTRPRNMLLVM